MGANLGDRLATLREAVARLAEVTAILARSRVYETAPIGPAQPDFLNAAVLVAWDHDLEPLLDRTLAIEAALGRVRGERWGPRVIDLDLLWAGAARVATPRLEVPHPRLAERAFAILPLLDVAPDAPYARPALGQRNGQGIRYFDGAQL